MSFYFGRQILYTRFLQKLPIYSLLLLLLTEILKVCLPVGTRKYSRIVWQELQFIYIQEVIRELNVGSPVS